MVLIAGDRRGGVRRRRRRRGRGSVPLVLGAAFVGVVPELRWRRWRWDLTEEGIDIQNGAISVNRTLIPWVRVQHVETQRGRLRAGFGLATVIVHNAAGAHTIPLLAQADAEELRERIAAPGEDRRR